VKQKKAARKYEAASQKWWAVKDSRKLPLNVDRFELEFSGRL
jgi:hypothetical protein